jgi:hypothetical protein
VSGIVNKRAELFGTIELADRSPKIAAAGRRRKVMLS